MYFIPYFLSTAAGVCHQQHFVNEYLQVKNKCKREIAVGESAGLCKVIRRAGGLIP